MFKYRSPTRRVVSEIIVYPVVTVAALSVIGIGLLDGHLITQWHIGPYMLLVADCSKRYRLYSGLVCAVAAIFLHSFIFMSPRWTLTLPSSEHLPTYLAMFILALLIARHARERDDLGGKMNATRPSNEAGEGKEAPVRRFWTAPKSTGNWIEDSKVGSEHGRQYVASWHRSGTGTILPWIVRDMVLDGRWTGIESGFIGVVGRQALRGITPDASMTNPSGIAVGRLHDNPNHLDT